MRGWTSNKTFVHVMRENTYKQNTKPLLSLATSLFGFVSFEFILHVDIEASPLNGCIANYPKPREVLKKPSNTDIVLNTL